MLPRLLALAVGTMVLAGLLTGVARSQAFRRGLLDIPNSRSSHSQPTPRGGGVAVVVACTVALLLLWVSGILDSRLLIALVVGGGAIAAVGFVDDLYGLSPYKRLAVHLAAATLSVLCLSKQATWREAGGFNVNHAAAVGASVIAITWCINLFNFMDGIDGIAASEAVFATGAAFAIELWLGGPSALWGAELVVAAACAGFLYWNWPPAKIFMGDVGSGYIGFMLGVLALASAQQSDSRLFMWLILLGVFVVDATVTLLRRAVHLERLFDAHRTHAYQVLARRWHGHRPVTMALTVVNIFWLFPAAWFTAVRPGVSPLILVCAWAPLLIFALALRAGPKE